MRPHNTTAFSEARDEYLSAIRAYKDFDDTGTDTEANEADVWKRLTAADELFFNCGAITAHEVSSKVSAAVERAGEGLAITDVYSVSALEADLARIKRMEPSQPIRDAFFKWRATVEAIEVAKGDDAFNAASDASTEAYGVLAGTPCTTPGDFIVKQYVRLHDTRGHCQVPDTKADMTANLWDVQRNDDDGRCTLDLIDAQTTYDDINSTDIGANLLAYGRLDFDAEAWLEAADRIGFRVDLSRMPNGSWTFGQCEDLRGEDGPDYSPRLRREQRRLQTLLNPDPRPERLHAICEEIRREWPQLVRDYHSPAMVEGAELLLAGIGYREDWSLDQLYEATKGLSESAQLKVQEALRVTGEAAQTHADALQAERQGA